MKAHADKRVIEILQGRGRRAFLRALHEMVGYSLEREGGEMPRKKRTAADYLDELADLVLDYLRERAKDESGIVPPLVSEIRQFLGRVPGRPTGMTEVAVRRLVRRGAVEVTWLAGDGVVILKRGGEDAIPREADAAD